jgi:hypothetical protein
MGKENLTTFFPCNSRPGYFSGNSFNIYQMNLAKQRNILPHAEKQITG